MVRLYGAECLNLRRAHHFKEKLKECKRAAGYLKKLLERDIKPRYARFMKHTAWKLTPAQRYPDAELVPERHRDRERARRVDKRRTNALPHLPA